MERNMRPPVQLNHDPWKIKKKLNKSDVNMLCRLLISKTVVNAYVLPELETQEKRDRVRIKGGLKVMVRDYDTETQHPLTLEYWKLSSKVFMHYLAILLFISYPSFGASAYGRDLEDRVEIFGLHVKVLSYHTS
ncbi:hypothetical protein Ancab_017852 [Ancistrocladus abbreviatus]